MEHHILSAPPAPARPPASPRRRGFAIILTALMLTVIIPVVGLVIDAGIMYAIRARLSSACDAAALSAAQSLSVGVTLTDQEAAARARATAYFYANFPSGTFESSNLSVNVVVAEDNAQTRTVTVTGTAAAPVYFMQFFGVGRTFVKAESQASRRDVNVMLVLDRSGSLDDAGACDDLESAAMTFTNMFSNQRDRMGMITYGGSYRVDYSLTKYFKQSPTLSDEINKLYPNGCLGWTGSAQALWNGYQQLANLDEPGALNVLVFFTDGQPNTITADFSVKTVTTSDIPYKSHCWDWVHAKRYDQSGWNPATQQYRGFIAASTYMDGLYQKDAGAIPVSDDTATVTNPVGYSGTAKSSMDDCYWRSNSTRVMRDLAYYPNTDYYGNSMFGYKTVDTYGSGHPYAGYIRADDPDNMLNAAINAVDNVGQRVRDRALDPDIPVTIYVIGLGGAGEAEHTLLRRIANSKDSPIYDNSSPTGLYLYAPSAAGLHGAFQRIASEILRLSK